MKKKGTLTIKNGLLYLFFLSIFLMGCGSEESGCLDIQATNFDVTADEACKDCCTYPDLTFRVNHVYDSLTFSLEEIYEDAGQTPYYLTSVQFYVSDIELVRADGSSVGVTDVLELTLADGSTTEVSDDFILINKSIGSYSLRTVGNISTSGSFTKIRFKIGVTPAANYADIDRMPSGHALAMQSDTMYRSMAEGYIFNKIKMVADTATKVEQIYEILGDNNLKTIELAYPLVVAEGFDVAIVLALDYKKLFEGINFKIDNEATILTKIADNTTGAFSL